MTKSMILPFVSVAALAVGAISGITISQDVQAQIAEAVVAVIAVISTIHGIIKNHK